jgi:hypothetical protein
MEITLAQSDIPMQDVSPDSNNDTASDTSLNSGVEQMKLQAELKPHENEGLNDLGWYQIKKFGFVTSNNSEICPMNNCNYTVENGQFSPNDSTGGYIFQGKLKVTTQEDDSKKSKFYNFFISLDKTGEEEANGKILQSLGLTFGTFGFGENMFSPDFKYKMTNSTLQVDEKSPILTIQGEKAP